MNRHQEITIDDSLENKCDQDVRKARSSGSEHLSTKKHFFREENETIEKIKRTRKEDHSAIDSTKAIKKLDENKEQ